MGIIILKTIPTIIDKEHTIERVVFNIAEKVAYVQIEIPGELNKTVTVDLKPMLEAATETQRTVIRAFFKQILASAAEVDLVDIPEVFESEV